MRRSKVAIGLLLTCFMVGFDALGQDSGNATIPPCASPEQLAALFSGTIVYEGDPVEGEDPNRSFDIWVIGAPDWTPKLVAGDSGFDGHPVCKRRFRSVALIGAFELKTSSAISSCWDYCR